MTDEDKLGRLYRTAISQLPGGRLDPALARATVSARRRHRARAAATAAVAASLTVLVVATSPWWKQPSTTAVPAGGSEPTRSATCPAVLPGTSNAAADYAELLRWNDQTYITSNNLDVLQRGPGKLGPKVTTITCSIAELTAANRNLVADGPWPNGTATFLPAGTAVFAIQGIDTRCQLGVRDATRDQDDNPAKIFTAVHEPDWEPIC